MSSDVGFTYIYTQEDSKGLLEDIIIRYNRAAVLLDTFLWCIVWDKMQGVSKQHLWVDFLCLNK